MSRVQIERKGRVLLSKGRPGPRGCNKMNIDAQLRALVQLCVARKQQCLVHQRFVRSLCCYGKFIMVQVGYIPRFGCYGIYQPRNYFARLINPVATSTSVYNLYLFYFVIVYLWLVYHYCNVITVCTIIICG